MSDKLPQKEAGLFKKIVVSYIFNIFFMKVWCYFNSSSMVLYYLDTG